jgi:ferritin-like protein
MIFGYITFFRLEELAIDDYRRLVFSQDAVKMNVFLQFLFNAEGLREHVRSEWMTLYDYTYIDEKIIGMVEKNLPNVADILRTIEKRATGKATSTAAALSQLGGATSGSMDDLTKFSETGGLSASLGGQSSTSIAGKA